MINVIRRQEGISLIEVLVGMLVFSLGMLLLIPMVVTSITGNQTARNTDRAMEDLQNVVEAFKAGGIPDNGMEYDVETGRHVYWWIQETDPPTENLNELVVEIQWEDPNGDFHYKRLKSYVYRKVAPGTGGSQ